MPNATNGIEPPEDTCPLRSSRKGPKQIVPSINLKNFPHVVVGNVLVTKGISNVVAVMQKFFDQAISGNWSYNPTHFDNNEVPMSVMLQDMLTTYKLGWKTSYYQNTYDLKQDPSENEEDIKTEISNTFEPQLEEKELEEEACESCTI